MEAVREMDGEDRILTLSASWVGGQRCRMVLRGGWEGRGAGWN